MRYSLATSRTRELGLKRARIRLASGLQRLLSHLVRTGTRGRRGRQRVGLHTALRTLGHVFPNIRNHVVSLYHPDGHGCRRTVDVTLNHGLSTVIMRRRGATLTYVRCLERRQTNRTAFVPLSAVRIPVTRREKLTIIKYHPMVRIVHFRSVCRETFTCTYNDTIIYSALTITGALYCRHGIQIGTVALSNAIVRGDNLVANNIRNRNSQH